MIIYEKNINMFSSRACDVPNHGFWHIYSTGYDFPIVKQSSNPIQ